MKVMKKRYGIFFWIIIISLFLGVAVALLGIYLIIFENERINNNSIIITSYITGTFTLLTPTLTRVFLKLTTKYEMPESGHDSKSPQFIIDLVENLSVYKKAYNDFFKNNELKRIIPLQTDDKIQNQIESAVAYEVILHLFSFFWQNLAIIAFIISLAITRNDTNVLWLFLIPFVALSVVFIKMTAYTEGEYEKYFKPCNRFIYTKYKYMDFEKYFIPSYRYEYKKNKYIDKDKDNFLQFIAKKIPPLNSVITVFRFFLLASNIVLTIIYYGGLF